MVLIGLLALGAAAPYLVDGGTVRSQLFTKMSGWADGRLDVRGQVYLTSLFDLTIEAHDVEIQGPARFPEVETVQAERIAARLSLWDLVNQRIAFEKIWLDGLEVALKERPEPMGAGEVWRALLVNDPPVLDKVLRNAEDAPFLTMVVEDARVVVAGDARPLVAGLGGFSGVVRRAPGATEFSVDGTLSWRGRPVEINLARTRFTPEGPTETAQLSVRAEGDVFGRIAAEGRVVRANGVRFMGGLDVSEARAEFVAGAVDIPAGDALEDVRVSASGRMTATARDIALEELRLSFGESRANGLLRVDMTDKPKISGTLGLGRVDLRGLSVHDSGSGVLAWAGAVQRREGRASGHAAWLAQATRRFDVDLRVSAESVILDGVSTGPAAAFVSVTDGLAALHLAELRAFGGSLNGQFEARSDGSRFHLSGKGRAEGIELGQFLAAPGAYPLATGSADISFTLRASAPSLPALVRRARLSGRLVGMDGGELVMDVAALAAHGAAMEAANPPPGGAQPLAPSRGEYDTLTCAFDLAGGRLEVRRLEIVHDAWLIRGAGRIDLVGRTLDWQFDAGRFTRPAEASGLPFRDSTLTSGAEKAIGLHVRGSMDDPRVIYRAPASELSDVRG